MEQKFHYSFINKLIFYLSYFFYKIIIPFEVKDPRWKMWWYEFKYTIAKFKDYNTSIPWRYSQSKIRTKFGVFKIRVNTSDAANVSPAFERRDINYLLRLIKKITKTGKKVLFLDIGADLGGYSVIVANRFAKDPVRIKCFEPVEESCSLIRKNLAINGVEDNVKLYPVALLNGKKEQAEIMLDTITPGSSSMTSEGEAENKTVIIRTEKLDDVIGGEISEYDAIVFKIDVEGVEQEVLVGAKGILNSGKDIYIMVEDFIKPEIINYLGKNGWSFMTKVTSYNSWWHYKTSK